MNGAGPCGWKCRHTLMYDTDTGILYYDDDGTGGISPVELLNLKGEDIKATDFFAY